jgi:hypothetical protein
MGALIAWIIKRFGVSPNVARYLGIGAFVLALFLLIMAITTVSRCTSGNQKATQGRIDKGQEAAASNSAADAISTQSGVNANAVSSEDLTRSNREDIRNAQGANDKVNPAVRDAGLASLCKRPSYRNDSRCKLRNTPSP